MFYFSTDSVYFFNCLHLNSDIEEIVILFSEKEEDVNYNSKPTGAPTIDPTNLPCEGADKFVGWTTGEYKGDSAPTKLYPTADDIPAITEPTTFYAVFADYE